MQEPERLSLLTWESPESSPWKMRCPTRCASAVSVRPWPCKSGIKLVETRLGFGCLLVFGPGTMAVQVPVPQIDFTEKDA
jgi:hypothetical protein